MMIKTFFFSILAVFVIKGVMVFDQIDFSSVWLGLGLIILLPLILKIGKISAAIMIADPK